jgi:hypothetical protein
MVPILTFVADATGTARKPAKRREVANRMKEREFMAADCESVRCPAKQNRAGVRVHRCRRTTLFLTTDYTDGRGWFV